MGNKYILSPLGILTGVLAFLCSAGSAYALGTATDITGLYYTGVNSSNGLLAGGTQESHWAVTYASVAGTGDAAYMGSAYVVSGSYIDAGWTPNTTNAQWIVPPGASTAATGGTLNVGGDYLPGNGTGGNNNAFTRNEATFAYTLAFNIVGTGSGTVTNAVSISLTLSADDQYSVYVNPTGNGTTLPTGTAAGSATSAWNSTAVVTLQNGTNGTGPSGTSIFKIGTNYITIVVDNTNSITTTSNATALNPSGLLVYQVGSATLINGQPIPEVGAWLPAFGALGLFCWRRFRPAKSLSIA
jgi:hypothetical protein